MPCNDCLTLVFLKNLESRVLAIYYLVLTKLVASSHICNCSLYYHLLCSRHVFEMSITCFSYGFSCSSLAIIACKDSGSVFSPK